MLELLQKNFIESQRSDVIMNEVLIAKRSALSFRVHAFLFSFLIMVALYCGYAYPQLYTEFNIIGLTHAIVILVMGYLFGRLLKQPKELIFAGSHYFIVHSNAKKEIRIPFSECTRIEGKLLMNKTTPYPFGSLWIQSKKESVQLHHVESLRDTLIRMREMMGTQAQGCIFEIIEDESVTPLI